jgi:hypothetical protein
LLCALAQSRSPYLDTNRERAEAQRAKEEEDKRREKLLNTKVPIGKPTNSAIMKAEKVCAATQSVVVLCCT